MHASVTWFLGINATILITCSWANQQSPHIHTLNLAEVEVITFREAPLLFLTGGGRYSCDPSLSPAGRRRLAEGDFGTLFLRVQLAEDVAFRQLTSGIHFHLLVEGDSVMLTYLVD